MNKTQLPKYFVYDDACHLKLFISKRKFNHITPRASILFNKVHVVDKFHYHNHDDPYCKANCNPHDFQELQSLETKNRINTVICEEINFWLNKHKHMLKHFFYS